jgi:hypothetical protein
MSTLLALLLGAVTFLDLAGGGARFPEVQARRLDGRAITLPGGLEGQVNLLFIAFQREQQAEVDTWMPATIALAESHPGLEWCELPTISALPGFLQFFLDKARLRAALGLPHENAIGPYQS